MMDLANYHSSLSEEFPPNSEKNWASCFLESGLLFVLEVLFLVEDLRVDFLTIKIPPILQPL